MSLLEYCVHRYPVAVAGQLQGGKPHDEASTGRDNGLAGGSDGEGAGLVVEVVGTLTLEAAGVWSLLGRGCCQRFHPWCTATCAPEGQNKEISNTLLAARPSVFWGWP